MIAAVIIPTAGAEPVAGGDQPAAERGFDHQSRSAGASVSRLPDGPDRLLDIYKGAAQRFGIDWRVLASSGYSETLHGTYPAPGIRSAAGAVSCCRGVMAICVSGDCGDVWSHYAVDGSGDGLKDPYEPADSIYTAARIYRGLQNSLDGDRRLMWAAYNAGIGAVTEYGGVPPYPETQAYVERCEGYFERLGSR